MLDFTRDVRSTRRVVRCLLRYIYKIFPSFVYARTLVKFCNSLTNKNSIRNRNARLILQEEGKKERNIRWISNEKRGKHNLCDYYFYCKYYFFFFLLLSSYRYQR
ncbi:hypothetical protein K0M31_005629 [Melipona bicolor]|uniref:Uncharacterized protein n=1 Tax=Melipona bicolor TaxID=60889 RepID=A0AA40FUS0_9HYME|nr:hypothetical protein K0M31_005629 [Melipona bicolor]